ncbi:MULTISPECIES: hypothetical protein [Tenebrionibacter/Tenebrionicola group]|uniref:Uncharacterized protein n=2 Tax=Tenebrionibacter/Tenebrionicola group TaxID=2969848 RepID=A0A8K0V2P3_9ENTR|nr:MULTISPECIES: hypothetical protein [Tenebrionibacter/Tenebrionicola group]MBK4714471.1 hypothetical protein [Tenebrionibacter intestinalis]MBV4412370.1 hypothetical protein [Tenebrionicola larvae]MBV5095475.1 hypothetical protein [Tenebrionicola larvae]
MLWLEQGLYVKIVQLEEGPRPLPLRSGFSTGNAYRVLGCFNPSESADAYYILSNDRDEIWFICNRHVRTVCLNAGNIEFRYVMTEHQESMNS